MNAQVETIYLEDFSTVSEGAGFPSSLVDPVIIGQGVATKGTATLHPRFGRFSVNGTEDRLEALSISNGEVMWETDAIDIACFKNIKIEVLISGTGPVNEMAMGMDAIDYAAVDLILVDFEETYPDFFYDAGPIETTPFVTNSAILNTCFGPDVVQQIKLKVRFLSDANFEGYNLHYVKVTGESATPKNISYSVNCDSGIDLQLGAGTACAAEYSLDGLDYTNTSGLFENLPPNTNQTIYVRDQFFTTCVSTVEVFVTDCDVVLPIELVRFTGQAKDNDILLEWETASELNNDYMAVEHSIDGIRFQEIGRVRGAGTTYESQQYELLHRQPQAGVNYYRLRQVDIDGTATFHEIIVVESVSREGLPGNIRLYPTVAREQIRIELSFPTKQDIPYQIYTLWGQQLRSGVIPGNTSMLDLPIQELPGGTYILSTAHEDQVYTARFFKQD